MKHHQTLSPSSLPALAKCIHYKGKEKDTQERLRGKGIHDYMRRFLESGTAGAVPMNEVEWAGRGEWLAGKVKESIKIVGGIEQKVTLYDEEMEPISWGYADVWGWSEGADGKDYLIVDDAKSGFPRDYIEQMAFYCLALMEEHGQEYCRYRMLYCDSQEIEEGVFSREHAEQIVMDVIRRVQEGKQPETECQFCEWCARRRTCQVWTVAAQAALVVVADLPLEEQFRIGLARIAEDPVVLGRFLTAWHRAEKLVDDAALKEAARSFIAEGKSVEGWTLQPRSGPEVLASSVDFAKVVKAAAKAKTEDLQKWQEVLKVSVPALRKSGFPVKIETSRTNGTSALVRKS